MPGKSAKKLDKKTQDRYRKQLLELKEKILDDIKQLSNDTNHNDKDNSDVSGHALHMADVATDMYDREFSLGLASNDREVLHNIDEALQRIDEGKFGLCQECQKQIPAARLKAIPYVNNCRDCQEKLDENK